jgi:F-type H+-transporting ATPase subunit delta
MEEIARVYARALFEVAKERGKLDELREQLAAFADALAENSELRLFFFSPYFSTQEQLDGLARVLDGAEPELLSFLGLLIEKHRVPVIFRIRRAYEQLWEQENRILNVEITSAVELDQDTVGGLSERIRQGTGRTIALTTRVDPDILGGIVLRVGNAILDASISHRLEQLRRQVATGTAA